LAEERGRNRSLVWRRVEDALLVLAIAALWVWVLDVKGTWVLAVKVITPIVLIVITARRVARLRRLSNGS